MGVSGFTGGFQLIPARGRKHDVFRDINLLHGFQLIPARGRKPHSDGRILGELPQFQLIPARGRKLHPIDSCIADPHISTYPRKGTETKRSIFILLITLFQLIPARGQKTPHQKKMRSFSFANLNSLFSVGYSSMNRAAAAFSLPWLLYCDKMCYNRVNSKHLLQNTQTHFLFIVQFFHDL